MHNRNASGFLFSEHSDKMLEAYKLSEKNQHRQNKKILYCTIPIFGQLCDLGFGA